MKHPNFNAFFMLLVVLLQGSSSSTQEFNIEIPKECQHLCDSKRPKRTNGPYLLTCFDNDCSDVSCDTHKCPPEICKNGRQIFCPSAQGSYHTARKIKAPIEPAPTESGVDTFYLVFWAFTAFVIIGICCGLVSWNSSRNNKTPEAHLPAGYIISHQDKYRSKPEKTGRNLCCCVGGNEDEYHPHPKQQRIVRRSMTSSIYFEEDEEKIFQKQNSLNKMHSEQKIVTVVLDPEIRTKSITAMSTTEIQEMPTVSSISIIKAPPVQGSTTNMPTMSAMSIKLAESASSIETEMQMKEEMVIDTRPSST